ncbi:hypothetical protein AVEN_146714-1 [Araneus ventricosus]|uniref:Uncharacterized protein n=1 Tax=Araneus ventricosus TaxID=182803 RepID=A0A4Y2QMP0_ARAVE|nr:hypothetical protein AVEN_146714-1 [Araneus ventricosus]
MKVLKEELQNLFKQYLDIEDEKYSKKSDYETLELQEDRDEIEISLKCLLSKYNANEIEINENKSDHNSDLKSYIDHIELKSKKPEIPLPIFYGKIEELSNFKNQFVSLITDNKELTNDQKLFYLKAALRGEAKLIETSDYTLESLFSALEECYKNKRAVVVTRTLKALAEEEQKELLQAAATLLTDVYIDDILSGSNNLEETKVLQHQIIQLLKKGGLELHKWVSNYTELLHDNRNLDYVFPSDCNSVKTLGMQWHPTSDIFTFKMTVKQKDNFSKREVLSNIARLLDPLGLISPVITSAKIFLQRLWLQKLNWKDTIPPNDLEDWLKFLKDSSKQARNSECANISNPVTIDLYCFCDALDKAYGAVLYLCSKN